jgi:acyl carrier protein
VTHPASTIARRVRDLIARVGEVEPDMVTGPARLTEDLGFDSLRLVELALALESEFAFGEVDETTVLDIVTVADIEALIRQATGTAR